jgi:hypothetical protein
MILLLEPFHYATADFAAAGWTLTDTGTGQALIETNTGRRSARALRVDIGSQAFGNTCFVHRTFAPGDNQIRWGFAFYAGDMTGQTFDNFSIMHGSTPQLSFMLNSNRTLSIYRGNLATLLNTTTKTLQSGTFYFIEVIATIATGSGGSYEVWVDNVLAMSGSSLNTAQSGSSVWNGLRCGYNVGDQGIFLTMRFMDMYVLDGVASADGAHPNNARLGDLRVDALAMTAEGTTNNGTPTSGTDNSAMVDDATPDGATTEVTLTGVGDIELYVVQDAPVAGAPIIGFQLDIYHKKSDAGTATIAPAVRDSGTNYFGSDIAPGTSYGYSRTPYDLNPGTTLEITESEFNALEVGLKKTA